MTATARAADEVCSHRVPLLGRGAVDLGDPIDWHRDPVSGLHWELRHHSTIDYLDLARSSDVRLVWELSRCHQWVTLGQAHWLTGDARYAAAFVAQWEGWMAANPPGFGVNWTCAMEAAIRAINWLWAYFLFAEAPAFDEGRQRRFLSALAEHARFILRNLEIGPRPGNHYLTDGLGLLALGTVLREVHDADAWLAENAYPDLGEHLLLLRARGDVLTVRRVGAEQSLVLTSLEARAKPDLRRTPGI